MRSRPPSLGMVQPWERGVAGHLCGDPRKPDLVGHAERCRYGRTEHCGGRWSERGDDVVDAELLLATIVNLNGMQRNEYEGACHEHQWAQRRTVGGSAAYDSRVTTIFRSWVCFSARRQIQNRTDGRIAWIDADSCSESRWEKNAVTFVPASARRYTQLPRDHLRRWMTYAYTKAARARCSTVSRRRWHEETTISGECNILRRAGNLEDWKRDGRQEARVTTSESPKALGAKDVVCVPPSPLLISSYRSAMALPQ
jgi:hypothetical protein